MSSTTELQELVINYLSDEKFKELLESGQINENELYMTPTMGVPTKVSQLENDAGYLTEHQDISGKLNTTGNASNTTAAFTQASSRANITTGEKLSVIFGKISKFFADLKTVAFTGSYNDLNDKPSIPNEVTESTVSSWGFTKNTGTYTKPSGGIPKTDLASAVQTSLGKADTALQSFTESDPTVPDWAKAAKKPTYALSEITADSTHRTVTDAEKAAWNNKSDFSGSYNDLEDKPSIPTVPTNVSAFNNDAGYLTEHQDISGKLNTTGNASNTTATFTQASSRTNISTGEKLSVIFGKIAKFFADLKTVAFTGSYNDLSDKPTIPTVPTNVSAFTNDAGYLTEHQSLTEYAKKSELPTVPTNVSAFTNDAGYLTEEQYTGTVKSVNGTSPDASGNVTIAVSSGGFKNNQVTFNGNTITEVGDDGTTTTTISSDGKTITEVNVKDGKTTTLTTTIDANGNITQVVS